MGTKFANVHVKSTNKDEVISYLKTIAEKAAQKKPNLGKIKLASGIELDDDFSALLEQADLTKHTYYIGEFNGWISILNDWFEWGTIDTFSEAMSCHIASPILTVGYFDDDILEINIFRSGKRITGHIWCSESTQEVYGLDMKHADINAFVELLGHEHALEIRRILELIDCEQAVIALEKVMNVPLWIHSDWFADMEEQEVKKKYLKHKMN
ncbi:hypothetical protein D3C77_403470 [compost metagenome]